MIVIGSLAFLPGFYYTYIAYAAYKGCVGICVVVFVGRVAHP